MLYSMIDITHQRVVILIPVSYLPTHFLLKILIISLPICKITYKDFERYIIIISWA